MMPTMSPTNYQSADSNVMGLVVSFTNDINCRVSSMCFARWCDINLIGAAKPLPKLVQKTVGAQASGSPCRGF